MKNNKYMGTIIHQLCFYTIIVVSTLWLNKHEKIRQKIPYTLIKTEELGVTKKMIKATYKNGSKEMFEYYFNGQKASPSKKF